MANTTFNDILNKLHTLSEQQLRDLNTNLMVHLKSKRDMEIGLKRVSLSEGDKVSWSGRNGYTEGTIVRIKRKKAICTVDGDTYSNRNWDVPLNMLKARG